MIEQHGYVSSGDQRERGKLFNEVPELYERARPSYPDELFADLAAATGVDAHAAVLEIGCGTGQATRSLAQFGGVVTAIEPGAAMAEMARQRLARFENVVIETADFEAWAPCDRRFDLIAAASSWHWIDPRIGWRRAHDLLRPGGWLALLGHVVSIRPFASRSSTRLQRGFAPTSMTTQHVDISASYESVSDETEVAVTHPV